jgi:hypothetical protein
MHTKETSAYETNHVRVLCISSDQADTSISFCVSMFGMKLVKQHQQQQQQSKNTSNKKTPKNNSNKTLGLSGFNLQHSPLLKVFLAELLGMFILMLSNALTYRSTKTFGRKLKVVIARALQLMSSLNHYLSSSIINHEQTQTKCFELERVILILLQRP